jgi:hypothetical protein
LLGIICEALINWALGVFCLASKGIRCNIPSLTGVQLKDYNGEAITVSSFMSRGDNADNTGTLETNAVANIVSGEGTSCVWHHLLDID